MAATKQVATVGGGCFWCVEAVYNEMAGVDSAISGYMGGRVKKPTYEQVCDGETGHAEVVQVKFDPTVLSYKQLLDIFFTVHDPTQLNRQGNDVGTQYRSVIFYHDEAQRAEAQAAIDELNKSAKYPSRIVTELSPATEFYPAEDYHQRYFARNPSQPYVAHVVTPKVHKARDKFPTCLLPSVRAGTAGKAS